MTLFRKIAVALILAVTVQGCAFFMDTDLEGYGPANADKGPDASGSVDADSEGGEAGSAGGSGGFDGSGASGGFAGTVATGGNSGSVGTGGVGGIAGGAGADASAGTGGAAGAGGTGGTDASAGSGGVGGLAGTGGSAGSGGGGFDAGSLCLVEVAAGFGHACAREGYGTLWCWGENDYGQLGNGTTTGQTCGSLVCNPQPAQVMGLGASAVEVTAGRGHTCVRKGDGSIWCWGLNGGTLGDGTIDGQACGTFACKPVPVQVTALGTSAVQVTAGFGHTCVRKDDGTVWCWGGNQYGSLGDGTTVAKPSPVQVTALGTSAVEVAAGGFHTCARKSDGTVWCWGANEHGQLGDSTITTGSPYGKPTPVQVTALGTAAIEVEPGYDYTCARKSDGTLWCWGDNEAGQLGDGTTASPKPSPVQVTSLGANAVDVSAGGAHTCARTNNGALWCWGLNHYGAIGDGTTAGQTCGSFTCKPSPVQVASFGTGAIYIATGWYQTCARKIDGSLWCWGGNEYGQVGDGTTASPKPSPVQISPACP